MIKTMVKLIAIGLAVVATAIIAGLTMSEASDSHEIKFSLGRNIVDVAKDSGVPRYQTRDIEGYVSYSANNFMPKVYGTFLMSSGNIRVGPLFSIAMYSDKRNDPRLIVESINLQIDTDEIVSHETARKFIGGIISSFNNGNWDRYVEPLCPAVTGRSTFLDIDGHISQLNSCSLDPGYTLSAEDWVSLMQYAQTYQWKSGDTLASLKIKYTMDATSPAYTVWVEYEAHSVKLRRETEQQKKFLEEGDKKGWKSSEEYENGIREKIMENKILEQNSIKRGDPLINPGVAAST